MELDELKKQFLVDKDKYHEEKLPELIKRALVFCKVDKTGAVFFEKGVSTNSDKIRLVLLGRFLANKLDKAIPLIVSLEELSRFIGADRKVVAARIKELIDQKNIKREKKGRYSIYPYQLESVLDNLERRIKRK